MNLLVTGGCGYVGTKLTEALLARTPHDVTVLDVMWFGNRLAAHPRLTVQAMDVRRIDEMFNQMSPGDEGGKRQSVDIYEVAIDEQLG